MLISLLLSAIPTMLLGVAIIYFNDEIAMTFRDTKSISLIRGLDNPWTFKALGWLLVIGSPIYQIISWYLLTSTYGV